MKRVVFDSFALLAFFRNEKGKEEISDLLVQLGKGEKEGFLSVINLGEIYYISHRKDSFDKAEEALLATINFPIQIEDADIGITLEAAKIKAKYKLSYADAFAAALTIAKKATLITGDPEFKNLKETNFKVKFI